MDDISIHELAKLRGVLPKKRTRGWSNLYAARKTASKEWWKIAHVPMHMEKLIEFQRNVPWLSVEHGPKLYWKRGDALHPLRFQITYHGDDFARKWVLKPRVHAFDDHWSQEVWDHFQGRVFDPAPAPYIAPRYGMDSEQFAYLLDRLFIDYTPR